MKKLLLSVAALFTVTALSQAGETVSDICKNTYPVVTIGTQVWMAENYRCSKYDTESEAYNAKWLTNNTIPTSSKAVYTPYYTDASDKSKWDNDSKTLYGVNLNETQISKLGYLYNWAAAVGVENGYDYGTTPFTGNRQGICPNEWHVPTSAEWQTLQDYIEVTQSKGSYTAGKHLKTTSGWYNNGNGEDTYGFAALPAGYAYGSSVDIVGGGTYFWTATPGESYSSYAYSRYLVYGNDYLYSSYGDKGNGQSVRCVKSPSTAAEETQYDAKPSAYKQLVDGQIIIFKGGKKFNLQGVEIK